MIDFSVWEEIDSLTIEEAACLWYEINPSQKDKASDEIKGNIKAMITLLIEKTSRFFKMNFFIRNYGLTKRYGYFITNPYTRRVKGFKFKEDYSPLSKQELIDDYKYESEAIHYTPETKLSKESYREVAALLKEEKDKPLPLFLSHGGAFAISDLKNYGLLRELLDKNIVHWKQDSAVMACFNESIENEEQLKERFKIVKSIGIALTHNEIKDIEVHELFAEKIIKLAEGYIFYGSSTSKWDTPMYITFDDYIDSEERLRESLKQGEFGKLESILDVWKRSKFNHTEVVLNIWRETHHGSIAFTREKIKELLKKGESFADNELSGLNLSMIDFRESNIKGRKFAGANIKKAMFNYEQVFDMVLVGVSLAGTNLSGINLSNIDFRSKLLGGLCQAEANLKGTDLTKADLCHTTLCDANLCDAIFYDADISFADLDAAKLNGAKLDRANLYNCNLRFASLKQAELNKVSLRDAVLKKAVLNEACLENSDLYSADLEGVILTGAKISGANFSIPVKNPDWKIDNIECDYIYTYSGDDFLKLSEEKLKKYRHDFKDIEELKTLLCPWMLNETVIQQGVSRKDLESAKTEIIESISQVIQPQEKLRPSFGNNPGENNIQEQEVNLVNGKSKPYCKSFSLGCEKMLTQEEYKSLLKETVTYDMFIDGLTKKCHKKDTEGKITNAHLTNAELNILSDYIQTEQSMCLNETNTNVSEQVFKTARKKVDIAIKRCEFRAFARNKKNEKNSYRFAPPENLNYCLILPL